MSAKSQRWRRTFVVSIAVALMPIGTLPANATVVRPAKTSLAPTKTLYPLPAPPIQPEPCPAPPLPPGKPAPPLPPAKVPEALVPVTHPQPPRHVDIDAVRAKGIWLTLWPGPTPDIGRIVAIAKAEGLNQIWVRTGSTHDGFYGAATLRTLIPSAHAAHIKVIAWDFPTLSDPVADAARAAETLAAGVNGFGADIESSAEGTYLTARRVSYYLSTVDRGAGTRPIIGIVPAPTKHWLAIYPYATVSSYVDVVAPMVYWSCVEPGAAVTDAIATLGHSRPIAPIGQDYDMATEGGRHGLPTGREIWRFLDASRRAGAIGASLYSLEAGGDTQLTTLGAYPWKASA